jgi:hypothetical protein
MATDLDRVTAARFSCIPYPRKLLQLVCHSPERLSTITAAPVKAQGGPAGGEAPSRVGDETPCIALLSVFGFQHLRPELTGDVARRTVIADDVPRAISGLRHAHAEGFRGLPDELREMAGFRLKTGLVEIILLYFAVPVVDDYFGARERRVRGPRGEQVLPIVLIATVHQPLCACELFCIVLCRVVELCTEYQWGHTMLGPVAIVLLQGCRTKGCQVAMARSPGVDVCASDQAQDDFKEYGSTSIHRLLRVWEGVCQV